MGLFASRIASILKNDMKITPHDILLGSACTGACSVLGLSAAWGAHALFVLPHGFQAFYLLGIFLLFFTLSTYGLMLLVRILWPMREGTLPLGTTTSRALVWKLFGYLYVTHLWPLINAGLVPVNLRSFAFSMLGAKIGRSVMIGGKILDPSLVEIGDFTMLGEDCLLTAHAVEGERVDLGRIIVGSGVTIGVKAVVLPDVVIGDGAIVAAGAVVTKGARIAPGEIWGGVPARKIGMVATRTAE
jgi:carbonic anhydrase/acetyltransferase-like protein (isoleucine patch superfamily)